jgi:hypothetical protein
VSVVAGKFRIVELHDPMLIYWKLLSALIIGGPLFEGRIIGGIPVAPPPDPNGPLEYPYVVSIELDNKHFCAGFIYNPKWIVTTASCMEKWV